ncbi:unnamed protein product [Effrenium voratum]|nr:unnamed protein product [Effrenium voratum]
MEPMLVIVVGGGLAGLCASIEAAKKGALVTIIDKEAQLGGNSVKASSGMNGAATQAQRDHGIEDSVERFVQDTLGSGDGLALEALVQVLARQSAEAHDWLRALGLHLSDVVQLGGHSTKRTHRFPAGADGKPLPVGWTLISGLRKIVEGELKDLVTVRTKSTFKELAMDGARVVGLKMEHEGKEETLHGKVVLTAGGYANDHGESSLLERHVPELSKLPTTNGPFATGDVIKAVIKQEIGVKTTLMDKVQIHPTGFIEAAQPHFHTKFLAPEALRGCGALLLCKGKRFANELGRRDYLTKAMFDHCEPLFGDAGNPLAAALLLTEEAVEKYGKGAMGFYQFKGLVEEVGTVKSAAEKMGVTAAELEATLEQYNEAADRGSDEFGKTVFPVRFPAGARLFLAFVTPSLHYCMGGLAINERAEVLREDQQVLPGLFAAGEVTGGVHGHNRLGGNSLLECVVFGRLAGRHAAEADATDPRCGGA